MVNPKKDYELLMRYLQGDALKREPADVADTEKQEVWQPAPQATTTEINIESIPENDAKPAIIYKRHRIPSLPRFKFKPLSRLKRLRIALAVIATIVLFFIFWQGYTFYQLSPDKIYNSIYPPYIVIKNDSAGSAKSIEDYYAESNYVAATLQSKKQKQFTDKERLLIGLSYLLREDYSKAIKWLEPAANNFKSPYRQQSEFYLALTYLKNEDYDHCIEKMRQMTYNPSHLYYNRIPKNVIEDIKMLKWK